MGIMETGVAKSRAAASDARADLAEINSKLLGAESLLKVASGTDRLAERMAQSWLGRNRPAAPVIDAITTQTNALHARAEAHVDELTAKRAAAQSRLSVATRSQQAMNRIAEESDKVLGD